jgi:hypothetical protein
MINTAKHAHTGHVMFNTAPVSWVMGRDSDTLLSANQRAPIRAEASMSSHTLVCDAMFLKNTGSLHCVLSHISLFILSCCKRYVSCIRQILSMQKKAKSIPTETVLADVMMQYMLT